MAVQKSKKSKSKARRTLSAWMRMDKPTVMACPQCHELKLPHRICPECGYYNGREVISKTGKTDKE